MIISIASGVLVLAVAFVSTSAAWSAAPWSAPEPVRLWRSRRARIETDDRYELAVRRGRLVTAGFDSRLRPMLTEVATTRLRRRGIDMRVDADDAVRALGPDLAIAVGLLSADDTEAARRTMTLAELDRHLRRLEAL